MTIKTQGGKVITKDGKVSCECCGVECCMYPAQALADGLYSADDLPDTVVQVSSDVPPVVIVFTKLSSPQPGDGLGGAGTPTTYFSGTDSFGNSVGVGIYSNDEEPKEWKGTKIPNESSEFGECLLSIGTFQSNLLVWRALQDQFAGAYTIGGPISGTVTRESICVWAGTNLRLTNFGYQWRINGNSKSGDQNTPVGSYAGGFSVS